MNPVDDLLNDADTPIDDGVALLSQLSAAVSWLRRGAMPGLTLWDVFEQALRWRQGTDTDWQEADPLRAALRIAVAEQGQSIANVLGDALRQWLVATSGLYNDASYWNSGGTLRTYGRLPLPGETSHVQTVSSFNGGRS
jgi:hypothetical protein